MTYVLNKFLEKNKGLGLYSPGSICHLCRDMREEFQCCSRNGYCEECQLDMKNLRKCKCEKTLTVCSYHVTYAFLSEFTLYNCLNVKELLARNRRDI